MSTFFQSFLGAFMAPKVMIALAGVLTLILGDFILGVLVSFRSGTFDVRKLPQFMESSFVPYAGGLLILALFSSTDPTLEALFFTIAALVHIKFLADIKDKFTQLFSGLVIKLPSTVTSAQDIKAQPVPLVSNVSTDTPAATKTLPTEDAALSTPDAAPQTIQEAITQGIRQAVQPVAQQTSDQTVQTIIAEAIQSGVKQIQPSA